MPIAINGSGTVTGISVGGLPDGIVDTDMIAAAAVTAPKRGPGAILQVVQHSFTTGQFTTTSNSYVDVTGFTQAITPTAASSKILVMLSCQVQTNPSGTYNGQCDMSINRSINGGSYTAIAAQNQGNYIQETYAMYHDNSLNINLLDSPSYSLGNAITYKMQVKSADTSVTTRVNVTCGGITNGASKLLLVEVAA